MTLTRTRRRALGTIAIGGAAALALAGCGSSGAAPSGGAQAWALTGQQVTIQNSFDAWNADAGDQQVHVEFFENDAFKQKIRTAIGSGDAPTLIWSWGGSGNFKTYVDADRVIPLDESLAEGVFPAIADNGRIDGTLYAVPNNTVQPVMLFYNQELFDEVGLDGPAETWDELLDQVATFSDAGIAPFSMGGSSKWPQLMWLEYLVDRIGGPEVFEAIQENQPDAWSDPAVTQALEMIQQLVDAGGFIDGYESVATDSSADIALVYSGRAAMILQGGWAYADFKTADPEFVDSSLGWTSFPAVGGGAGDPANMVGNASNYWSISADASEEAQDAAAAYLENANMDESYVADLLAAGGVPPIEGIEDEVAQTEDADFLTDIYSMSRDAPAFTLSWDQALAPGASDTMLTSLDQIFLGQIDPQAFVDAMNATIE